MNDHVAQKGGWAKRTLLAVFCVVFALSLVPSGALSAYAAPSEEADATEDGVVSTLADTWDGTIDTDWYNKEDTEFTLTTAAQLAGLAAISTSATDDYAQDNFKDKTVKLGADIDLAGISWNPISDVNVNSGAAWRGTFDGCGHYIVNLNVESSTADQWGGVRGFISVIGIGGVVRNVGIAGEVHGRIAGGIVGETNFTASQTNTIGINEWPRIENCYANVDVYGNGSGRRGSGGIFGGDSNSSGNMYCNIINCYSVGNVSNVSGSPTGGLAGICAGIVAGSYSTSTISAGDRIGGNVASMYMKGFDSGSYNFTAQGTYVNNMTTTSPSYRYWEGTMDDNNDPISVTDGVYTDDEIKSDGVSILGEHAWEQGANGPVLYWQNGGSDYDISAATVVVNSDNTVTVTLGTDTLVEYTDYFAVGEGEDVIVYGVGRYTGEAKPGEGGVSTWDGSIDISWYNTTSTTFTLTSADQLAGLAAITTPDTTQTTDQDAEEGVAPSRAEGIDFDNFEGKTVKLACDIDLNNKPWSPISDINIGGDTQDKFNNVAWQGTFDGGGHVVENMIVDGASSGATYGGNQGFISTIGVGGLVRNLGVTGTISGRVVGGIVGCSVSSDNVEFTKVSLNDWPRIENCFSDVTIDGDGSGSRACAGIFGGEGDYRAMCNVINCYAQGSVSNTQAGGVSGQTNGIVAGCYSTASVTSSNTGSVTSSLFLPSYSSDTYKAIGVFTNNIGLEDPVYRYYDADNRSTPAIDYNYGSNSPTELREKGVSILGSHAWKAGTEESDGYPQLYWQVGESDTDLSNAEIDTSDGKVTVTLDGVELIEYTDYFVEVDDLTTTVYGVGRYTGTAQTEEKVYFKVETLAEGSTADPTVVKKYSQEAFEALAATDGTSNPVSGLYSKDEETWNVASSDYYVTLSSIYDDANIDTDEMLGISLDNSYYLSKDELADQNKFFPDATMNDSPNPENYVEVPAVFALTSYSDSIGEGQTAAQVQESNLDNVNGRDAPRFICGINDTQYSAKNAEGNRLWKNCSSLVVIVPGTSLDDATVTVAEGDYVFLGNNTAITPDVSVTLEGVTLTEGTDYTVTYSNNINAGEATVTVTGAGRYVGELTATFTIDPADIGQCTIASIADQTQLTKGEAMTPDLTVTDDRSASFGMQGPKLVLGTDYTAEYENNTSSGTATVTITGMGNYTNTKSATFEIVPYFTVYYQYGSTGTPEVALALDSRDEFEAEADAGVDPVSAMFYQESSGGWKVATTSHYVTVEKLLNDAGLGEYWKSGASLSYGGGGSSTTVTYDTLAAENCFFPAAEGTQSIVCDSEPAPAVLSIYEYSVMTGGADPDAPEVHTAKQAEEYNLQKIDESAEVGRKNEPRMLYGITEEDYLAKAGDIRGNRYWSNCSFVTIILPAEFANAQVSGIDASYDYTGSAIAPVPTVTLDGTELVAGTDYEVSYSNNINPGTATVTITPLGEYAGQDPITVTFEITTQTNIMTVYAGDTRYDTAGLINVTVSESGPYNGVIVCSGENGKFADALCASGLSGVLGYPIVLTNGSSDVLDAKTSSTVNDLLGSNVGSAQIIVLGGSQTVSDRIATGLSAWGTVERIAGDDRYATAEAVYDYGASNGGWSTEYAVVAKGNDYPDALGAASFCTTNAVPMLLTDQNSSTIESYVAYGASKAHETIIVGGTTSVSEDKARSLGTVERMDGADRYATNLIFAKWQIEHGMTLDSAGVATGANFPDSLGSSFLLSLTQSVLLLVAPGSDESAAAANVNVYNLLSDNAADIHTLSVFGGENSVAPGVKSALRNAVGGVWDVINK